MLTRNPKYNFGIQNIRHATILLATTILGCIITLSVAIGVGWMVILLIVQLTRYIYAV